MTVQDAQQTSHLPTILITNPIHEEVQQRLRAVARLDMNPDLEPWPQREVMRRAVGASAMMGFMTDRVDSALLRAAPQLKIVACALKGFDNYDVAACTEAGVWVSIVPDLLTEPTAELALGLAISLGRHIRQGDAYVRSGAFAGWRPHLYGTGLWGSTVAVIGLGRVGCAIVNRLAGFGCALILGVDPTAQQQGVAPCGLDHAMREADYVFVAAPLMDSTRHLIGSKQLAMAKPGQLIINIGRGSVIDESAMCVALESGRIGGYAADVFGCEDWGLDQRPESISVALLSHPKTVFTPHIGSAVSRVRIAIEQRAATNIMAVLAGLAPQDAINRVGSLTEQPG
jgi:phosphonate dehydrogenase